MNEIAKRRVITAVSLLLTVLFTSLSFAQAEFVSPEELLFMEIPIVVTAAKKEQLITQAPATIVIITAEDIKQSGVTNIPDLLRTVAGAEVMAITVRDQQVSIRGFNSPLSNKLMVLLDGRSVYWDGNGGVYWDILSIGLEEIERIEVVKSPASSLYGANAYCGVINIITKSPGDIKGTSVNLTAGDYHTFIGSILHSGMTDKIGYKFSTGWDRTSEWRDKNEKAGEITRGNALVEYKFNETSKLSLAGGRSYARDKKSFIYEETGTAELSGYEDYLKLNYNYTELKLATFMKKEVVDVLFLRTGEKPKCNTATYDLEVQYLVKIGENNSIIYGGNYRYNTIQKTPYYFPDDYNQNLWAVFAEGETKLTDKLRFTIGSRYDWHPLVKEHFSPRASLIYSPKRDHTIRFSAVKAFRNPIYIDSYAYTERQMTITLPRPFPAMNVPYTYLFQGNRDLKSEGITSYELGYRSTWLYRIIANLNLFYNEYTDFFMLTQDKTFYRAGELFPGSPGGVIPKRIVSRFRNSGSAWGSGGEIDLDILITDWLTGVANYAYQQITDKEDYANTITFNEKDKVHLGNPKNKVNAGLRLKPLKGLSVNLTTQWVDKIEKLLPDISGNEYLVGLDDHLIFNTRLGYIFLNDKAEVSLVAFNIFNNKYYEYPPGVNLPDISSDKIGCKITAGLSYKF